MRSLAFGLLSGSLLLAQPAIAAPQAEEEVASTTWFNKWVYKRWEGSNYACKCYAGDSCWPNALQWKVLNHTVDGNLRVNIPIGAPCYNQFQGPLGTVNTYDAAKCAEVTANFANEQYQ